MFNLPPTHFSTALPKPDTQFSGTRSITQYVVKKYLQLKLLSVHICLKKSGLEQNKQELTISCQTGTKTFIEKMTKWNDFQTSTKHLIILIPISFLFMFINAGIYLPIHSKSIITYITVPISI